MNTLSHIQALFTAILLMCLLMNISSVNAQQNEAPVTDEQKAKAFRHLFSGTVDAKLMKTNQQKSQFQTCGTQLVYRNIDGQCNNINNAAWGSADISLKRELPAEYGSADPLNSIGGEGRPNPRVISNAIFAQDSLVFPSNTLSAFVFSWGQFLDHDIGISPESEDDDELMIIPPSGEPGDLIVVPIEIHRAEAHEGTGVTTPREQTNIVTSWVDGSQVYGSDVIRATWLRQGTEGKMKTSAGNLLPYNTTTGEASTQIDPNAPEMASFGGLHFVAGDVRANEQSSLLSLHTLFVREHNRICDEIIVNDPTLDPIFDDQTIYERARKQVVALLQNITYNEFLPALGVNLGAYSGYDNSIQPDIINGFSTAAYRLGHTMVTNELFLLDDDGNPVGQGQVSLIQAFFNPNLIAANGIEPIFNGLAVQFQEEIDANMVEALRTFLFTEGPGPGLDLAALNIQRGRDHGLADYNAYRNYFTGSTATNYADITSDPVLQNTLSSLYGDINDIDAWVGLLSEDKMPGSQLGATLTAMLTEQFGRLRDSDYYFYRNDPTLTNNISTIESTTLSDVVKRNTNIITLQNNVFNAECDALVGNCCRLNDSLSLVELYDDTNGVSWTIPWNLNQPMTTWQGVTLNGNGCVQVINLPNNGLSGTLPAAIGDFEYLTYLDLSNNNLAGNIPTTIGTPSNRLGYINLGNNQFTGNIPNTFYHLTILTFLRLENNNLTGKIPPELANMSTLKFLYVHDNQLSGCYDPALLALCGQLNAVSSTNANISDGNNFSVPWEDFCDAQVGNCDTGVWPGDMNNDGIVDENEVLFWGIAAFRMGPPRPNATTNWNQQPAQAWQLDTEAVNNKHQDADGSGTIDGADLQVVDLNFGLTTGPSLASFVPNTLNYRLEPLAPAGGNMRYALHVEDFDGNDIMAHGVACTVDFNDMPLTNVSIDVTGSSLTPDEVFEVFNTAQNRLSLALTRTDGVNTLCDGAVAVLTLTTNNAPTGESFNMDINKGNKIEVNGDLDGIANMSFYDSYVGFSPASNNLIINASVLHEQCSMLGKASVEVYGGVPPYFYTWSTGANTAEVENLPSGTYTVVVGDVAGNNKSLTVQINGQIPIYDNNGNLICASPCPQFANPTGDIGDSACQANEILTSDGTIPTGGDVQFKAGENIILEGGFEVQPNANFSAEIDDCN